MTKITILSIFLCCFFIVSGLVFAKEFSDEIKKPCNKEKKVNKNCWNIRKNICSYGLMTDTFFLYDEHNHQKSISYIRFLNGKGILNPLTRVSPVPLKLTDLTLDQAKNLWGSPSGKEIKTFKTYILGGPNYNKKCNYFIDTKFENQTLMSYRIRGPRISDSKWIKIK